MPVIPKLLNSVKIKEVKDRQGVIKFWNGEDIGCRQQGKYF